MPGAEQSPATAAATTKRVPIGKIAAGVLAVGVLVVLARTLGGYVPQFIEWVGSLGVWGPIVYIAGYAAATVAFIPGSVLTLAGGAIFGLAGGFLYVFTAAVLGSSGAFLVARYLARRAVEQRLKGNPRFAAIDRAVGAEGLKIVFLLRLSPIFPFNALNYGLGLTGVRFRDYLIASLGMIPGTFLYVYYGFAAGEIATIVGQEEMQTQRGPEAYAVYALGLVATVVVTAFVTRIARRALREATGEAAG